MIQTENNLITVSGVTGYIDENGTAWLNLDNVARGLGFTQTAASGNEVVRWERVNKYLSDFGFIPTSGDALQKVATPKYIPENIFYRLAMKAKNETAEAFQGKVADEILPQIRKTGSYTAKPMTPIQMLAAQAQAMAQLEQKTNMAIESANNAQKQIAGAVEALAAPTPVNWQTATGEKIRRICKANGLSYLKVYDALYRELEHGTGSDLKARLRNEKDRQRKAGHKITDINNLTQLYIIAHDKKLKMAFDGIVCRFAAKYAMEVKTIENS